MKLTAGQKASKTREQKLAGAKMVKTKMKNRIRELELKLQASKELFDKKEVNLKRKLAAEKAAKARMKNGIKKLKLELQASKELCDKLAARVKELEGKAGEPSVTS